MKGQNLSMQLNSCIMASWEISFKIRYDYPLIEMSERYKGSKITMWCVWEREMIHIPFGGRSLKTDIEEYVKKIGRFIEEFMPSSDGLVLTLKCSCDLYKTVWQITERTHTSDVGPATYLDGWGYFRVIAFNEKDIKELFHELSKLGNVELLSKKSIHQDAIPLTVWAETFFSDLTEKQMEALSKAYDYGYYSSPRKITTESISATIGISRSTYEEHLRKAENKVIQSLMPYLKLYKSSGVKKEDRIIPAIPVNV